MSALSTPVGAATATAATGGLALADPNVRKTDVSMWHDFVNMFSAPQAPNLSTPTVSPPSQATAAQGAIQTQLAKEQNAYHTSTILSGASGLMDEPQTTSSILHGS